MVWCGVTEKYKQRPRPQTRPESWVLGVVYWVQSASPQSRGHCLVQGGTLTTTMALFRQKCLHHGLVSQLHIGTLDIFIKLRNVFITIM